MKFVSSDTTFTPKQRASIYLRAARLIRQVTVENNFEHYCLAAIERVVNPPFPTRRKRKQRFTPNNNWPIPNLVDPPKTRERIDAWMANRWEVNATNMPEIDQFNPKAVITTSAGGVTLPGTTSMMRGSSSATSWHFCSQERSPWINTEPNSQNASTNSKDQNCLATDQPSEGSSLQ